MKRLLFTLPLFVALLGPIVGRSESAIAFRYFSVSAPRVKLHPSELIYGLTLDTTGAVILRMKVPFQWNVAVDNSDGGRSHLKANAIVGASAFGEHDLDYFTDFVDIGQIQNSNISPPFDVSIILQITDEANGKERKLVLPRNQLTLTSQSEP